MLRTCTEPLPCSLCFLTCRFFLFLLFSKLIDYKTITSSRRGFHFSDPSRRKLFRIQAAHRLPFFNICRDAWFYTLFSKRIDLFWALCFWCSCCSSGFQTWRAGVAGTFSFKFGFSEAKFYMNQTHPNNLEELNTSFHVFFVKQNHHTSQGTTLIFFLTHFWFLFLIRILILCLVHLIVSSEWLE